MLSFDEINRLARQNEQRSMDIDRFFDEMGISEESKEERKEFARSLENSLLTALAFLFTILQAGYTDGVAMAKDMVEQAVLDAIRRHIVPDSELILYAQNYAEEFVDATIRNQGTATTADSAGDVDGEYFFSEDRAKLNAENEANTVFNYEELREAQEEGMGYKRWNTMKDEKVRLTHAEIDGTIVRITDTFDVGGYPMQYPRQIGAPAKEVVNCRCWLTFQKTL